MNVKVIPIRVDTLGIVPEGREKKQEELEIRGRIEIKQARALKISENTESLRDLLSIKLERKITS